MKKATQKLDALIFIDTNIFLDFYRMRKTDVSLKYLTEIETHKDRLILSSQVEMEFRKNRQKVLLESINNIKRTGDTQLSVPAILLDAKPVSIIKDSNNKIDTQLKKIRDKIERFLNAPSLNDKVFQTVQRIFKTDNNFNLHKNNKERFRIRKLAFKRFILGYPPRKKEDNSIGDAINWEWIIDCAKRSDKHIIIVTRDNDFGATYGDKLFLNDWLQVEFKERISQKRKIVITDKLSVAFKILDIKVTEEMVEAENSILVSQEVEPQVKGPGDLKIEFWETFTDLIKQKRKN